MPKTACYSIQMLNDKWISVLQLDHWAENSFRHDRPKITPVCVAADSGFSRYPHHTFLLVLHPTFLRRYSVWCRHQGPTTQSNPASAVTAECSNNLSIHKFAVHMLSSYTKRQKARPLSVASCRFSDGAHPPCTSSTMTKTTTTTTTFLCDAHFSLT